MKGKILTITENGEDHVRVEVLLSEMASGSPPTAYSADGFANKAVLHYEKSDWRAQSLIPGDEVTLPMVEAAP